MQSKFSPETYSRFRHEYPLQLFDVLKGKLNCFQDQPLQVLDLGAGTGLVSTSFLKFFSHAEITFIEPDASMLGAAKTAFSETPHAHRFIQSTAETFSLPAASVDLALIGSAWHWMKPAPTLETLGRVLKPGGLIFIFEYQFPKTENTHSELNEWIRRQFNLVWKAPVQNPRGSLAEITQPLRDSSLFSEVRSTQFVHERLLSPEFLAGTIFSQSRYLHYSESLPENERQMDCEKTRIALQGFFGEKPELLFRYPYQGYLFQKRY